MNKLAILKFKTCKAQAGHCMLKYSTVIDINFQIQCMDTYHTHTIIMQYCIAHSNLFTKKRGIEIL